MLQKFTGSTSGIFSNSTYVLHDSCNSSHFISHIFVSLSLLLCFLFSPNSGYSSQWKDNNCCNFFQYRKNVFAPQEVCFIVWEDTITGRGYDAIEFILKFHTISFLKDLWYVQKLQMTAWCVPVSFSRTQMNDRCMRFYLWSQIWDEWNILAKYWHHQWAP